MAPTLNSPTAEYFSDWTEVGRRKEASLSNVVSFRAISAAGLQRPTGRGRQRRISRTKEVPHTQCDSWADETDLERGVDNMEDEVHGVGDIDWELFNDDGSIDDIDEAIDEDEAFLVAGD